MLCVGVWVCECVFIEKEMYGMLQAPVRFIDSTSCPTHTDRGTIHACTLFLAACGYASSTCRCGRDWPRLKVLHLAANVELSTSQAQSRCRFYMAQNQNGNGSNFARQQFVVCVCVGQCVRLWFP